MQNQNADSRLENDRSSLLRYIFIYFRKAYVRYEYYLRIDGTDCVILIRIRNQMFPFRIACVGSFTHRKFHSQRSFELNLLYVSYILRKEYLQNIYLLDTNNTFI